MQAVQNLKIRPMDLSWVFFHSTLNPDHAFLRYFVTHDRDGTCQDLSVHQI